MLDRNVDRERGKISLPGPSKCRVVACHAVVGCAVSLVFMCVFSFPTTILLCGMEHAVRYMMIGRENGQYARGLPLLGGRIFCSNGVMGGNRGSETQCFWGSILRAGRCCGMSCGGLCKRERVGCCGWCFGRNVFQRWRWSWLWLSSGADTTFGSSVQEHELGSSIQ